MSKSGFLLPLVLAAVTVSSCENQPYDEDIQTENYTHAFIREFGLIDPNHTWGFVDEARSRTVDVNGNDWVQPPSVTTEEVSLVMNYLKKGYANYTKVESINFTRYFVTQVGGSFERYTDGDEMFKTTPQTFVGSQCMDHLNIKEKSDGTLDEINTVGVGTEVVSWEHCNNFNASSNANYGGNTVMYDSGTWDFAYYNSKDSRFHNRYVILHGPDIDPSLNPSYYYVCFDFEANYGARAVFSISYTYTDNNGVEQTGNYNLETNQAYSYTDHSGWPTNAELEDMMRAADTNIPADITISSVSISRYITGNQYVEPNDIYDDWVVRIVGNAVRKDEIDTVEVTYPKADPEDESSSDDKWKRVMVEDLSIRAGYNMGVGSSDWDFNDVVFDVTIGTDGKAKIKLQALGGTLPVYIGIGPGDGQHTQELHNYYGVSTTTMVNTGQGSNLGVKVLTSDVASFTFDPADYRSVKVYVDYEGEMKEMQAVTGGAPAKICVPPSVAWADEKQHITSKYPKFREWVSDMNLQFWTYDTPANPADNTGGEDDEGGEPATQGGE